MLLAGLIAWLVAALAFALVLLVLRNSFSASSVPDGAPVSVTIGRVALTVPAGLIRIDAQKAGGTLETLDLMLDIGTLGPAGAEHALDRLVFLSFERAREGGDPAGRTEELYARFLTPETAEADGGLIRRRFKPKSPYDDEELVLAPPDGRAFAARCGPLEARTLKPSCLWQLRHGGLDIGVRFDPAHLGDWQRIAAGVFDLLAAIRRVDGGASTP
jgi:hypothetical protein